MSVTMVACGRKSGSALMRAEERGRPPRRDATGRELNWDKQMGSFKGKGALDRNSKEVGRKWERKERKER